MSLSIEERIEALRCEQWRVMRSFVGDGYQVVVSIDGQVMGSANARALFIAEESAWGNVERALRAQAMRRKMRVVR